MATHVHVLHLAEGVRSQSTISGEISQKMTIIMIMSYISSSIHYSEMSEACSSQKYGFEK